jgi:glycosyltransferase involved in cell wall biosynthesis
MHEFMTLPLVSIILPTYNGSRYLRESVESCIAQTYRSFELIIVDDGSTDNTAEIINEFVRCDDRVKAVHHETNRNLPSALNSGFAIAKGKLFTWTSDDNIYLPNAIADMADFLCTNTHLDIVYCNYGVIDENGRLFSTVTTGPWYELPICDTIGACFMYRNIVDRMIGGYDSERFCVEDYAFWLKAYNAGFKYGKLDELLYWYRMHANSLTGSRGLEVQRMSLQLTIENSDNNAEKMPDNIRMRSYLKCIRYAKNIGDKQTAIECMRKAIAIDANAVLWASRELIEYATEEV